MKKYFPILKECPLFHGIEEESLGAMLSCLGAKVTTADKNQPVFREGDPSTFVGVVLSGSVQILREDYYGKRSIVAGIAPTELFGESFACAGVDTLPVSVVAAEKCEIMLLDCRRIMVTCHSSCSFHNRMIFNLLGVVARKNLVFHQKIEITSKRTTREKLIAYLLSEAKKNQSSQFTIPYDRQALADYLEVERSAMSAEISKLRKEGIFQCEKSHFVLNDAFFEET